MKYKEHLIVKRKKEFGVAYINLVQRNANEQVSHSDYDAVCVLCSYSHIVRTVLTVQRRNFNRKRNHVSKISTFC